MSFELPTQAQKHDYVHEQFERIARGYDLSNDVISMGMHRAWKLRAVHEMLGPNSGGKFLDVCCGTGDLALLIARQTARGSTVTGLDFSGNMLELAERRQARLTRRKEHLKNVNIKWVQGDAQNLPFDGGAFDGAIVSFGLRNLTDLQQGLNEMARVVRRGGRVVNLDLGHCEVPVFAPIFNSYFGNVVPVIGAVLQKDRKAYTYLPESLRTYPRPEGISAMFEEAGLVNVRHIPLALGTVALHVGIKP